MEQRDREKVSQPLVMNEAAPSSTDWGWQEAATKSVMLMCWWLEVGGGCRETTVPIISHFIYIVTLVSAAALTQVTTSSRAQTGTDIHNSSMWTTRGFPVLNKYRYTFGFSMVFNKYRRTFGFWSTFETRSVWNKVKLLTTLTACYRFQLCTLYKYEWKALTVLSWW